MDAEISSIVLGWLNPSANQSISCLKRAGFSLRRILFAEGFISVFLQTKALFANFPLKAKKKQALQVLGTNFFLECFD